MNPEPGKERLQTLSFKLCVELLACQFGCKSCAAGSLDVVWLRIGRVPEHHYGVANELVDCSAFREKGLGKHGEIARRLVHENVGVSGLGDSRKIPNVSEEDGNLLSGSAKLCGDRIIDDPLDKLLGDKAGERPYGALRELHCTAKFVKLPDA